MLSQTANGVIFASEENLRLMSASDRIFMDGTFKTCPRIFAESYTIHGMVSGHVVPLVYCLLPSKSREVYYDMIAVIKSKMASMDLQLNPDIILTDFEAALVPTLRAHFPHAQHRGC
jgi:hypothetical protein